MEHARLRCNISSCHRVLRTALFGLLLSGLRIWLVSKPTLGLARPRGRGGRGFGGVRITTPNARDSTSSSDNEMAGPLPPLLQKPTIPVKKGPSRQPKKLKGRKKYLKEMEERIRQREIKRAQGYIGGNLAIPEIRRKVKEKRMNETEQIEYFKSTLEALIEEDRARNPAAIEEMEKKYERLDQKLKQSREDETPLVKRALKAMHRESDAELKQGKKWRKGKGKKSKMKTASSAKKARTNYELGDGLE